jgi:hypothetical protein
MHCCRNTFLQDESYPLKLKTLPLEMLVQAMLVSNLARNGAWRLSLACAVDIRELIFRVGLQTRTIPPCPACRTSSLNQAGY